MKSKMKLSNKLTWAGLITMLMPFAAFAEDAAHAASEGKGWAGPIGVCLGMGLAVLAGATAQGRIGAAYMEGVSRNPSAKDAMFTPLVLALAFVEAMVLVTFVVVCFTGKF